ncbi:MAG: Hsp20/alpha crystallin family protein [Methylotenera sp.]|nr:Hsp20/alpha crystallin family protein [Methylotenera sp.]MDD4926489.1 Hsp20/alpha crystallin family protein [Methylotenera sp.]
MMSTENKTSIPVNTGKEVAKTSWPDIHPIADMERAFDRIFGGSWPSLWRRNDLSSFDNMFEQSGLRLPSLDVVDRDADILVRAEIPGIDKKDLNISLTDNLLTIKGESSSEKKEEKGDYYRHEISSASFARSVSLPSMVDASKTAASLKDGVLEITLPKVESSKRRSIPVQ